MNPSVFRIYPWSSVIPKKEAEIIALNIIYILTIKGNRWRKLTWDEYKEQRLKDEADGKKGATFSESEYPLFESVLPYTISESAARTFCKGWEFAGLKINT